MRRSRNISFFFFQEESLNDFNRVYETVFLARRSIIVPRLSNDLKENWRDIRNCKKATLFYSILSRKDWKKIDGKRKKERVNSNEGFLKFRNRRQVNSFDCRRGKGAVERSRSSKPRLSLVCRALLRPVDTERQGFYLRSTLCTHIFSILILCSSRLTVVCGPESDGFASIGWNNARVATQRPLICI